MSKRIKRVFSSHSQLCHVWAQQTQDAGRASRMFFEGDSVYSYGKHYKAGRIFTVKGKRFALLNDTRYSASTSGHVSDAASAVRGLMPYFYVGNVDDPKAAIKYLDKVSDKAIADALKRLKVTNKDAIKWEFGHIRDRFKEANQLRKLLGRAERWPAKKQLDAVEAHLKKRLKRYHELNTPEMIEKRAVEAERRKAREAERLKKKLAEDITNWRAGTFTSLRSLHDLPYELLRVRGDVVQTSRGAEVPRAAAVALYRAITSGRSILGTAIGNFTVVGIRDVGGDRAIKIGCHNVLLSEAAQVLGQPGLTLVSDAEQSHVS